MAKDWIMVRIERTTHRELERVRQSMLIGERGRKRKLEKDSRGRFSLDQVILDLIRRFDDQRVRDRRSKSKQKGEETNDCETATA